MPLDDLARAQSSLARTVALARAGEDFELAQKVRERGEGVSSLLAGLFNLSRVHAADNAAFEVPVAQLSRAIGELFELLGTIHLVTVGGQVYVNDVRIRSEAPGLKDLAAELAKHNVGGLTLHGPLAPEAVRSLVAAFAGQPAPVAPRRTLQQALVDAGVRSVELTPRLRYVGDGDGRASGRDPAEAIRRLLSLLEEAYDNVAAGRVLNVLPLRRSISEILDLGPSTPALWETLGEGFPHTSHAASVALVTLLVGKAAGLRTRVLQDIGVAALIHDFGYASLPEEIAATPEGLELHPGHGARILLRQKGFHIAKLRRLNAVLDHHRDHAGPRGGPSGLGQLLRLAEDYTTLLRVYGTRVSPADALGAISRAAGRVYHPALAQVMVNALGCYPPGTLVELADGRLARSVSPARSPQTFATPLVRVFDPKARTFSAERVDLALGGPGVVRALPG